MKYYGFHGNPFGDFKECGYTYKDTHSSAATHHRILNLVPHSFLDIPVIITSWISYLSDIHIHECYGKLWK